MNTQKENIRILVVDAVPKVDGVLQAGESLSRLLNIMGYQQIEQAASGVEALNLAKNYQPHLVLMDARMRHGPNGYEICRQMRQEDYGNKTAIILMADYNDSELQTAANEAGADCFFVKGVKADSLDLIIKTVLEKYNY